MRKYSNKLKAYYFVPGENKFIMSFKDLLSWTDALKRPSIIAGPCSVESEEQLRDS